MDFADGSPLALAVHSARMTEAPPPFDYESTLEACARGDTNALRLLYERESRWLLGVAQRIVRDRDRAHDVLQDAFLLIWQKAGSYQRALGSARGWIYTVLRHRALDEVRRLAREIPSGDRIEALADAALIAGLQRDGSDGVSEALDHCLEQLEPRRRDCIVRAFVDGYTYDQIARALGTPLPTVKSWIRRSLLALRKCLS